MCLHTLHELVQTPRLGHPKTKGKGLVESDFDSLSYRKAKHMLSFAYSLS